MEFKNIESFDPRQCISGKIMRINRITANVFRHYFQSFNLTDSQVSILFVMSKFERLTQKKITMITHHEKSSLHRNLKRLFERGYLTRDNFPLIEITLEGKKIVEEIIPEWKKAMSEIEELLGQEGSVALDLVHQQLITNVTTK